MTNLPLQLHKLLIKENKTIAIAESCTGGLLSSLLTRLPGSSKYFILGIVTYSNTAKEKFLKIPKSILLKNGAVSEKVAKLMAKNVRQAAKTDFGIGITGIAGPTGGSTQKPVGTVFIALTKDKKVICKKLVFKGNRNTVRKQAALKSLALLKDLI
ncbi:MAG: CinA family protein [Candidatus Omnitrophica bacterium]|nr:CinA family protein [Candidatus Omnitrophota bacterium]